jgi:hypothetical protein
MSDLKLFSVGEQWDWDRYINLQMNYNYFEHVAKSCFKTEYDKVTHYNDIKELYRHDSNCDMAIRFDNCFAKTNLETMLNSNIANIIEQTILKGFKVLIYVPTESFTIQDLRSFSKYFRSHVREKLHYANCNPNIFDYDVFGLNLHFVDYFSIWSSTGNIHWTSQVNYSKPKKDFISLALRMAPGKRLILDTIKNAGLYSNGYITDENSTIDDLNVDNGRYVIRSMTNEYEKHPNFMNITPWTRAVSFELLIEDTEPESPIYTSEKIYRTMYNKLPFIVFAKKGFLQLLKDLGYKTFDTVFDESYDKIEDRKERAEFISKEMKKFCDLTETEKQHKIENALDIIEHNYNHLTNPKNIGLIHSKPINSQ